MYRKKNPNTASITVGAAFWPPNFTGMMACGWISRFISITECRYSNIDAGDFHATSGTASAAANEGQADEHDGNKAVH